MSATPVVRGYNLMQPEMEFLQLYQRLFLETVKSGVIALDTGDIVLNHNDVFLKVWGLKRDKLVGKPLQSTELAHFCPELLVRLEASRQSKEGLVQLQCPSKIDGEHHLLSIVMRPMMTDSGERIGTVIIAEDISDRERLQNAIEQLGNTSQELQSANEELRSTNEELQSTNEELETTNEELQSTNEELATTNEELHSLNEELENINDELEHRSQELQQLNQRYAETLKSMPLPVAMVDNAEKIQLWNSAAQRLFGVGGNSLSGVRIDWLPVQVEVRKALIRRYRAVLQRGKPSVLRIQSLKVGHHHLGEFEVHFIPEFNNSHQVQGVLMMFGSANKQPIPLKSTAKKNSKNSALKKKRLPRSAAGKKSKLK